LTEAPEQRRESALRKKPHVEGICASLPAEHRAFCDEVLELLRRCLA
jgi:methylmalonyl-CoA mutase cobalamin-binding subunit